MAHFEFTDPSRPIKIGAWHRFRGELRIRLHRLLPVKRQIAFYMRWRRLRRLDPPLSRDRETALGRLMGCQPGSRDLERLSRLSRIIGEIGRNSYAPVSGRSREWLLKTLRPQGLEHLEQARGQGAIIVGSHVGFHRWVAPVLLQLGYPVRPTQMKDVPLDGLLLMQRDGLVRQVPRYAVGEERDVYLKRIVDLLKRTAWVQHGGDYPDPESGVRGELFGATVRLARAPWVVARLTGAPAIPVITVVQPDMSVRLVAGEPIYVGRDGPSEEAMQAGVQKYLDFLTDTLGQMRWNFHHGPWSWWFWAEFPIKMR